jgi:hypothetical protein
MACETHLHLKTKNYTTKRRYQQTRRDKQKTPQIMNDQLDIFSALNVTGLSVKRLTCSPLVYNSRGFIQDPGIGPSAYTAANVSGK